MLQQSSIQIFHVFLQKIWLINMKKTYSYLKKLQIVILFLFSSSQFQQLAAQDVIDLSDGWQFQIDRENKGVSERW